MVNSKTVGLLLFLSESFFDRESDLQINEDNMQDICYAEQGSCLEGMDGESIRDHMINRTLILCSPPDLFKEPNGTIQ